MSVKTSKPIRRGDFIEVEHRDENGQVDLLVRGTALTELRVGGSALFSVRPPVPSPGRPLEDMHFNSNAVDVRKLFDASVLEGTAR